MMFEVCRSSSLKLAHTGSTLATAIHLTTSATNISRRHLKLFSQRAPKGTEVLMHQNPRCCNVPILLKPEGMHVSARRHDDGYTDTEFLTLTYLGWCQLLALPNCKRDQN